MLIYYTTDYYFVQVYLIEIHQTMYYYQSKVLNQKVVQIYE